MRFVGNTPLIAEFTEVESGKRHDNRPQLQAALALCKKEKAKLVIANRVSICCLSANCSVSSLMVGRGNLPLFQNLLANKCLSR
jgi:DNA invertase Pin-like site-specific DNA recombinase